MSVIYSPAKIPVKVSKSEPAGAPRAKTEVRCTPPAPAAAEAQAPAAAEAQAPAEAEAQEAAQAPATEPAAAAATSKKGKGRK